MHKLYPYLQKTLILLLLCTLAFACSKDEDPAPEPAPAELIIGKWYFVERIEPDGSVILPENDCERKAYYEFHANGILNMASFSLDGASCKGTIAEAEYNLTTNGQLLLSDGTNMAIYEIPGLDETRLELKTSNNRTFLFEKR